jgi:hypothetical protein
VTESADNGRKVVVFSYFLAVLATVHSAMGRHAFGPITGSVTPSERQAAVDAFSGWTLTPSWSARSRPAVSV